MIPLYFTASVAVMRAVSKLCEIMKVGTFPILLAAYQTLISELVGEVSILNAISVVDRNSGRFMNTIGYLINAVPFRSYVEPDKKIENLIMEVAEDLRRMSIHRSLSYELYDAIFSPERPFCETLFNFVPGSREGRVVGESHGPVDPDLLFLPGQKFLRQMHHRLLYWQLVELPSGLKGKIFFREGLLEIEQVEKFVERYFSILLQFFSDPGKRICELT